MKRFTSISTAPSAGGVGIDAGPALSGPVVDCHQHRWSEPLVAALRSRSAPPRLDGWTLHLTGEPPYDVAPEDHNHTRRRCQDVADGLDRVLVSLSSPLGIESLAPEESAPLLGAHHALLEEPPDGEWGADGPTYDVWVAPRLVEPDPAELAVLLARPRACGLQVPATALADPVAIERVAPLLAVAEAADRPLLVHPGPAGARSTHAGLPGWWPALTDYPAQQMTAWFAWQVAGRALLPRLRVGFVALAGLAPLHHERLAARGARLGRIDADVFYETSSYGTRAIDAMTRVVGVDPLVHGSDRPYAAAEELGHDPGLGGAFGRALFVTNPAAFLEGATR